MDEYETFYAKVYEQGDSIVLTIPANLAKYGGYKKGDTLKVMTKRVAEIEKEGEQNAKKDSDTA